MSLNILNDDPCGVKVNRAVEYPTMQSMAAAEYPSGFILTLQGQVFSLYLCNTHSLGTRQHVLRPLPRLSVLSHLIGSVGGNAHSHGAADTESLAVLNVQWYAHWRHDTKAGPRRSSAGTPATCRALPLTAGTMRKRSATTSAKTAFDRSSSIASTTRSITLTTLAWTMTPTTSAG